MAYHAISASGHSKPTRSQAPCRPQALSGEAAVEGGGEALEWDSIRPTTSLYLPANVINHDTDPYHTSPGCGPSLGSGSKMVIMQF